MNEISDQEQAVELLQQLGLKEYEAKSFVALSRRPHGTAKDISETSEVPRTRVYDAIRVLESKGLVETQHSNPQVFRAVSVDEAADTLRTEYEDRTESLRRTLRGLDPVDDETTTEVTHEVWALSGDAGITSRTQQLIEDADEELVLVVGHESIVTDRLVEHLRVARDRGVDVLVGTATEELRDRVREALPDVNVFVSGLEWLIRSCVTIYRRSPGGSRLSSVKDYARPYESVGAPRRRDRDQSAPAGRPGGDPGEFVHRDDRRREQHEQGVFGRGFDNGLVAIARRLMATRLLASENPGNGGADRE